MYGITFSLSDDVELPNSDKDICDLATDDLPKLFKKFGFEHSQFENTYSYFYIYRGDDMVAVFEVMDALKKLDWFKESVTDIHAFKIEQWSNFTSSIKTKG